MLLDNRGRGLRLYECGRKNGFPVANAEGL